MPGLLVDLFFAPVGHKLTPGRRKGEERDTRKINSAAGGGDQEIIICTSTVCRDQSENDPCGQR
jgi:hypothetical protein